MSLKLNTKKPIILFLIIFLPFFLYLVLKYFIFKIINNSSVQCQKKE